IRRGDEVPCGATVREVVEGRELLGQFVRLVEGRVDGAGQAEVGGGTGEGLEHGEGVGASYDVEVVDAAAVLTQPASFGEEEEVEFAAFGGAGEVQERREVDLALRLGVGPHRGVVDTGEVRGEMNLLANSVAGHDDRSFSEQPRSGWRDGTDRAGRAGFRWRARLRGG